MILDEMGEEFPDVFVALSLFEFLGTKNTQQIAFILILLLLLFHHRENGGQGDDIAAGVSLIVIVVAAAVDIGQDGSGQHLQLIGFPANVEDFQGHFFLVTSVPDRAFRLSVAVQPN